MKKRVAAIVTEYRYNSHADVILGRLLNEFNYPSKIEIVSMYTDQIPDNDMSKMLAIKHGFTIYATVAEAIKAKKNESTIDGVIIIGEHGNYPMNEKDQKMYPRKKLMEETLIAMEEIGITVPIFSDKHLSYNMHDATWIYRQLKKRNITFMGGSSIPLLDPDPSFDKKMLETAKEIFILGIKENEINGYHAMDVLQSLAEQRSGGETGVASIQTFEGDEVWAAMERGAWPEELMLEALSKQKPPVSGHPREQVENPAIFIIRYVDGTKGYVLQLNKFIKFWSFSFRCANNKVVSAAFISSAHPYTHFERQTQMIEEMIVSGKAPFPMERTYISTGLINIGMESLYQKKALDSPELLQITYVP